MNNEYSDISIGRTVEIRWSEKDLEGTGWKPGSRNMARPDKDNDILDVYCFKDHTVYSFVFRFGFGNYCETDVNNN